LASAAEQRRLEFERMPESRRHRGEHPHRLGGDFAADAVAGENCDQRLHQERAAS
jgi:hypothetical protein